MDADEQAPNWTTIEHYYHPTDAHIAAGKLESEGIPVFLLGINHATANWLISTALGGIQLQVPAGYVEDARHLLSEREVVEDEEERCPHCGSGNSSAKSNSWKVAFLAFHLLNIPLPWKSRRRHCNACGKEWRGDSP